MYKMTKEPELIRLENKGINWLWLKKTITIELNLFEANIIIDDIYNDYSLKEAFEDEFNEYSIDKLNELRMIILVKAEYGKKIKLHATVDISDEVKTLNYLRNDKLLLKIEEKEEFIDIISKNKSFKIYIECQSEGFFEQKYEIEY